ncbi:reprolysin-like metallopeptidase [Joostella sp. CR20]|uniref:reprolysin-like metallopeptidase n=1 Tax=Joostella sp. CR20 TaxID=2804312 RepID=UPI00313BBF03
MAIHYQSMRTSIKLIPLFLLLFFSVSVFSQSEAVWTVASQTNKPISLQKEKSISTYTLDFEHLQNQLKNTPKRGNFSSKSSAVTIGFPTEENTITNFKITETNVFAPDLAKKYPSIKSYMGVSTENPSEKIYFSVDPSGFHGLIRTSKNTHYINPSEEKNTYYLAEKSAFTTTEFECKVEEASKETISKNSYALRPVDDGMLRTYRMALACTAEYAKYHTDRAEVSDGTEQQKKAAVLAAMNTSITRINSVYENDLAISLQLIANNDDLIFLDADTDGLTNGNGQTLINEIQDVIDAAVGFSNYDIGHVFSTSTSGGDGIAQLASVCTSNKARGVTGYINPIGDVYDIDFVAHEIGHQFGATHTFNNSCSSNRSGATSVEPGSGSTIMAYAGICPSNVQGNSDAYFHAISISQIWDNITEGSSTCGTTSAINNTAPVITELTDYTIPAGTPFVLNATVTDSNDDTLTYTWEQQNNEVSVQPPVANATNGPSFRSYPPSLSSKRFFPRESDILNNNLAPTWEVIPTVSRTLNFSLLVRDNNAEGGQIARGDLSVTTVKTNTPFAVTSQTANETLQGGSVYKVTWDVGETNKIPISTSFVDVCLILNNDFENPIILSEKTKNDGSKQVVIPGDITTSNARIMVKASDNIFFALNQATLSIEASDYALLFDTLEYNICQPNTLTIPFTYHSYGTFSEPVTFSATNIPPGLVVNFSETTVTSNDTAVNVTIDNTENLTVGINDFTIVATSEGGQIKEYPIELSIFSNTFEAINITSPTNGATEQPLQTILTWDEYTNANSYAIQISKSSNFSNIIVDETTTLTQYQPTNLEETTTYYWRIKPINTCGEGNFTSTSSFTTINISCESYVSNATLYISSVGTSTTTSNLTITDNGSLSSITVGVDITHSWLEDLSISLISPSGTVVPLIAEQCGDRDNIVATFSDDGNNISCATTTPTLSGIIKPQQTLSILSGEPIKGTWKLKVDDANNDDGGSINSFRINLCVNGDLSTDTDKDGVLDEDDLCPNTPIGAKVDIYGCEIFSLPTNNYRIKLTDESCISSNNGSITIDASENYNYTATLTGNGTFTTQDFKASTEFTNLSAGSYQLCFTTDASSTYQQCFDVQINEPEPLNVIANKSNKNSVSLNLSGSDVYLIELNGILQKTNRDFVELNLKKGINALKVYTEKDCQGIYQELIISSGEMAIFPNPFIDELTIYTDTPSIKNSISIFNITGEMVNSQTQISDENGHIKLYLSSLTSGLYMMNIQNENTTKTFKLLKK